MKTFTQFNEAKEKGATFTFGRFNPPTTGHAKLVKKLEKTASPTQKVTSVGWEQRTDSNDMLAKCM